MFGIVISTNYQCISHQVFRGPADRNCDTMDAEFSLCREGICGLHARPTYGFQGPLLARSLFCVTSSSHGQAPILDPNLVNLRNQDRGIVALA